MQMPQAISFIGLIAMMAIAWMLSTDKKAMDFRIIIGGLLLQVALAIFILKTPIGIGIFQWLAQIATDIVDLSDSGAAFIFGTGFRDHFFAFKVLPTIIFVSSLSYVLFYLGVLQYVVKILAIVMHKVLKISGAESLVAAANVFVGQTEAPLIVKPYLNSSM